MNKKALFVGAIFLTVAITIIIHEDSELVTPPNAGRSSRGALDVIGPAWLRSLFAINRSYLAS
jgi:hypothetical protein